MLQWIVSLDHAVLWQVNQVWIHPWADWWLSLISDFHMMKWVLLAVVVLFVTLGGWRGRVFVGLALLCALVGGTLVVVPFKEVAGRERPKWEMESVRDVTWYDMGPHVKFIVKEQGKARSMPSSHLANNASIVMVLMLVMGWRRYWYAWLWPLAMGYSRLYTGDHFPTDVLAGALVGCAYTLLICHAVNIVWRKFGGRVAPKLYEKHPSLLSPRRAA